MFDTLVSDVWNYLKTNYPTVFWSMIAVAAAIYVTLKLRIFYERFTNVEKKCSDIDGMKENHSEHKGNFKSVSDKLDEQIIPKLDALANESMKINSATNAIITYLITKDKNAALVFQSRSPVILTDTGIKLLETSGGRKYIDDNIEYLLSKMEQGKYKSALDVQNTATKIIVDEFNSDGFTPIKNYIFENPTVKIGKANLDNSLALISRIMSLQLRDKYFEKHPELKDLDE